MRTYKSLAVSANSLVRLGNNHKKLRLNPSNGASGSIRRKGEKVDFPNYCSGCGRTSNALSPISTTRKDKYVKTSTLLRVCPSCAKNMANEARKEMATL